MSEAKFTPGPWNFTVSGFIYDSRSHQIAEVFSGSTWSMHENARLIAAAPELLEALKELMSNAVILTASYLDTFRDWPDDASIQGWDKARWKAALVASEKAKSAIAKATGA